MEKHFKFTEDGKMRKNTGNIAQMNPFEFVYYYAKSEWLQGAVELVELGKETFTYVFAFLVNLLIFVTFPVSMLLIGYLEIKRAKKEVAEYQKSIDKK